MDDILLRVLSPAQGAGRLRGLKDAFSSPALRHHAAQDDAAFKKVVDAATAALYQGGEGQKIYDKWFTQKVPPKSLNLNTPISSELKNEFAKPSDSPDPDSYK
jgi:glutamate/aspartate transport system substrate-binding protein